MPDARSPRILLVCLCSNVADRFPKVDAAQHLRELPVLLLSMSSLGNLTERQVRLVLEEINRSHPQIVHSALSQVLRQDSLETIPASNTTPGRTNELSITTPSPRAPERDDGDALPPPNLLAGSRRNDTDSGDSQPPPVSHKSVRR